MDGHLGASRVWPSLKKLLKTSWDHLSQGIRDLCSPEAQAAGLMEESPAGGAG